MSPKKKQDRWLKVPKGYREFADCYEIDIEFTIDKDIKARADARRGKELRMQQEYQMK